MLEPARQIATSALPSGPNLLGSQLCKKQRQLWPVGLLLDSQACMYVCTKHHLCLWHLPSFVLFPHQPLFPATAFLHRCWFCSPQLCANTERLQKPKASRMYLHTQYCLWLVKHRPTPNSTELFMSVTGMLLSDPGEYIRNSLGCPEELLHLVWQRWTM